MLKRKLKILFFTPYAGRTGSEMFLWYMFGKIDKSLVDISLISECDGELMNQMPLEVKTYVSLKYPTFKARIKQFFLRLLKRNAYQEHILNIHSDTKSDYWYLNTVLMTDKIELAKMNNIPVIMHFHELTTDYSLITKEQMKLAIEYPELIIADSLAVYEKLKILGAKKVSLQYECIDISKIKINQQNTDKIKRELGLNKYSFVWLMSGTSSTRKGIDMIPELGKYLLEQNAALLWIGNNSKSGMDMLIEKEILHLGLSNVIFIGKKTNDYYDYMNLMDGFVLTSREEPFGMVVIEALALGKPVVSFNAGGVREILTPETGVIVDSWNVKDLADKMNEVSQNKMKYLTENAKQRALEFDVNNQVKKWEQLLSELPIK